jgi:hypothetical protein
MIDVVLKKIVSGGQTGVDRGALDAAIELEIDHGGWCPAGRRSERGRIPARYHLSETMERNYVVRTERNVVDSDGTLILFRNKMTGGTELTHRLALKHKRPHLCLDLNQTDGVDREFDDNQQMLVEWLSKNDVETLNVAGPRESNAFGIQRQAEMFLITALRLARAI